MDKKGKRLERIFPAYFELFDLPEGAREEEIKVYRACRTGACDKLSFLPTFEQQGYQHLEGDDPNEPGTYSLSTYEKPKDVKRFAKMNSEFEVPFKIAVGYTHPKHGLVQRTRERKPKKKDSHVDWWLYEDADFSSYEIREDLNE